MVYMHNSILDPGQKLFYLQTCCNSSSSVKFLVFYFPLAGNWDLQCPSFIKLDGFRFFVTTLIVYCFVTLCSRESLVLALVSPEVLKNLLSKQSQRSLRRCASLSEVTCGQVETETGQDGYFKLLHKKTTNGGKTASIYDCYYLTQVI